MKNGEFADIASTFSNIEKQRRLAHAGGMKNHV